jgi:hypothetical protein
MPADHGLRFDDDQSIAPAIPELGEPDPEQAITLSELRAWMEAFVD